MEKFQLQLKNGISLQGYHWQPEGEVRAYIVLSHGLGEHAGRYGHVAQFWNERQIAFIGYDHIGHGLSGGQRGHIPEYELLMEEMDLMRDYARGQNPEATEILYGHSFGGNVLSNYLIRRQPDAKAAILSAPWLTLPPQQQPSAPLHFLAKVMAKVYPAFTNENQIEPALLSTDTAVGEAYLKAPLVHGKITAGAFMQCEVNGQFAIDNGSKISLPTLLLHGEEDVITSIEGSRKLRQSNTENIDFHSFTGMMHEIHNETHKEKVLEKMAEFVESQLA